MAILRFTLSPEAVERFHNAISCLGKFNESITIEARREYLVLTALNSTNSAYAAFTFAAGKFFSKYTYDPPRTNGVSADKFNCKMYNKALFSVFKGRFSDPLREKDTGLERCEVAVEDGAGEVESRFVVKMVARHGVLKTYRLTFEAVAPAHAFFESASASNKWTISSRVLREFIEHFGPGTESLDIYSDDGRVNFTSFTEKIMSGNEVLKQPLHTSIAIDTLEFTDFNVEDKVHIVINVKDFKAIVMHAGLINIRVSASYSVPQRPMQLKYTDEGMTSEFILMTIGDYRGASGTPTAATSRASSKRPVPGQLDHRRSEPGSMPPPSRPAVPAMSRDTTRSRIVRPSPPPPQPSMESNALFFTEADDDRKWDPANYDQEEEEILGWDASADNDAAGAPYRPSLHNTDPLSQSINGASRRLNDEAIQHQHIAPTQRISQIRGMFDD